MSPIGPVYHEKAPCMKINLIFWYYTLILIASISIDAININWCNQYQLMQSISIVCLLFHVLATSTVISGWVLTYDNAHSWWLYNAASLEHQPTSTMTCYPTQSHYPDPELNSLCPILIMPSASLGSDKYQF